MGTGIINNLLKHHHQVFVYNRTKAHAQEVIDHGAIWVDSPAQLTTQAPIVITMVGFPQDVKEIYFGENGIFTTLKADQLVVDMTTSSPTLAEEIGHRAEEIGALALDAPVSGGDIGAKNATLTVMAGGHQEAFKKMEPLFPEISQAANYFEDFGTGQHAKMANQIMIAGTMTGLTEMLVYAKAANLDLQKVLDTVSHGSADNWSLDNYVPRILKNDYTPGFFAKHFLKDLNITLTEAKRMHIDLPATRLATQLYDNLVNAQGLGDDGTQALIKLWWK